MMTKQVCKISRWNSKSLLRKPQKILGGYFILPHPVHPCIPELAVNHFVPLPSIMQSQLKLLCWQQPATRQHYQNRLKLIAHTCVELLDDSWNGLDLFCKLLGWMQCRINIFWGPKQSKCPHLRAEIFFGLYPQLWQNIWAKWERTFWRFTA